MNVDDPVLSNNQGRHGRKGHVSGADSPRGKHRNGKSKSKKAPPAEHHPEGETADDMNGYPGIPTRHGGPPPTWQRSLDRLQGKDGLKKIPGYGMVPQRSRTILKYENGLGTVERKSLKNGQQSHDEEDSRKGAIPRHQFSSFGYRRAGMPQPQTSTPVGSPAKGQLAKPGSFGFNKPANGAKGAKSPPGSSDAKSKVLPRPVRSPPGQLTRAERKSPQEGAIKSAQKTKLERALSPDSKAKPDHNANTESWSMGKYQPPATYDPHSKSKSAMQKGIPQSSIKQMFGNRASKIPDGTSPSDTIISNPHATLKEGLVSSPHRQSLQGTTSLHMHPHHTVPSVNRRASSGLSVDFNKMSYNDMKYSGYMSDSCYTGTNRDSGLGSLHSGIGGYHGGTPPEGLGSLRRSESGSLESLDSNNSSSLSITSRATSERYGLTSPPTTGLSAVSRSNSLRSTMSEKLSCAITSKDMDDTSWMRQYAESNGGQLSPTSSTSSSQAPAQFFAMAAALGQMSGYVYKPILCSPRDDTMCHIYSIIIAV